jgi:Transglycosylase SLT domain
MSERARFIWAVGQQESGGNYRARNSGSGALGRWQIMPANLPGWAAHCGMPVVSPQYFLDHPAYQNRMVDCVLGGYYHAYGPRGAAAMWYSGQPDWHATYGNPPVWEYVQSVINIMNGGGAKPIPGVGAGGGPPPKVNVRAEDYSATVVHASHMHLHTGRAFHTVAVALHHLRR